VHDLSCYFNTYQGVVKALDKVSFDLGDSDSFGLVGETGCGKTVTALSILRLIPPPGVIHGRIVWKGRDILACPEKEMGRIRGREIAMIFQEPTTSLNPAFNIQSQFLDVIQQHQRLDKKRATERAIELLELVALPDPKSMLKRYPHELSGGMAQRAMIAMSLLCRPSLLIADEPTTALDVTIQAQILDLIKDIIQTLNMSLLMISHNLGTIAEMCKRVGVMYAGQIVERGDQEALFRKPVHPYTQGLFKAIPTLGEKKPRLDVIKGSVPSLINPPQGCRFHPRCKLATDICASRPPHDVEVEQDHVVACHMI
jgi:peptide/nickel transport system ATP-binding protein